MNDRVIDSVVETTDRPTIPVLPLTQAGFAAWRDAQPEFVRAWLDATGFKAQAEKIALLPGIPGSGPGTGALARVVVGIGPTLDVWSLASLPFTLPEGCYRLDEEALPNLDDASAGALALGWILGSYRFTRYRKAEREPAVLLKPAGCDLALAQRLARATFLVRDLVNTPAGDLGPAELAEAAERIAETHDAGLSVIVGDELLARGYPAIHAVGRASSRAPRLIDLRWGRADAAKVTIVGKGVCFDTGGLDLKSADNMRLMKKDMGGAAHALALAQAVMDSGFDVALRVLVPAVDNAVAGDAFRPGDIIRTRAGLTVEIGNTDAEGRLVLCDALAEADGEEPALMVDFATLTGAARVALGPELAALFTDDEALAAALIRHGEAESDPLWRLPLWPGYRKQLDSDIADLNNISSGPHAGAITAALYLKDFVKKTRAWAHFDVYAWNQVARPGRPAGGEACGLRAVYALIAARFGG